MPRGGIRTFDGASVGRVRVATELQHNARMTLTELRYIVAVAREKHFGRAAEACFVSQPTLSVAIKKLEEELDVKLFERGANEVSVTPLGEEIVRQAQIGDRAGRRHQGDRQARQGPAGRARCGWASSTPSAPTCCPTW